MTFNVTIQNAPAKRLVGIFARTTMERAREECSALWEQLMGAVVPLTGGHAYDAYGVSTDYTPDGGFVYWAALDAPTDLLLRPDWVGFLPPAQMRLENIATIDVRGGLYAVVDVPSLGALPCAFGFIYGEWAKGPSEYTPDMTAPAFEKYPKTWSGEADAFQLYVPVIVAAKRPKA